MENSFSEILDTTVFYGQTVKDLGEWIYLGLGIAAALYLAYGAWRLYKEIF